MKNIKLLVQLLLFMPIGCFSNLYASTITVMNTTDADAGSLRAAVGAAVSGDTILFAASTNGDTIKFISGQILIDESITIIGNGAANTIIDGTGDSRIFENTSASVATIVGLTLQNGNTATSGGAILISGKITIIDCSIVNNIATKNGGGLYLSNGEADLINVIVSGNEGGNFYGGGIAINAGTMDILNCVVSGNIGENGGGIGMTTSGNLTVRHSTISGNTASNRGSGIYNEISKLFLYHSLVAKNVGPNSGQDIQVFGNASNPVSTFDQGFNHIMDPNGGHGITSGNNIDPFFITDAPMAPSTGGDLRLQCSSEALDAGIADTTGLMLDTLDIAGLNRLTGKRLDIGAYERAAVCQEAEIVDAGVSILDSSFIAYGEVCLPIMDTFFIKNSGKQFLIIDSINVDTIGLNPTQFVYNLGDFAFPDSVACEDSLMLIVTFSPAASGLDSAIIRIYHNEVNDPIYDLIVSGSRDILPPQLICRDTTVYLDAQGQVVIDSSFLIDELSDVCGSVSAAISMDIFDCAALGVNTVTLTITEASGLQSMCTSELTVLDTISPIISCVDTTIFLDASGMITIDSSYVISSMSDNCGIASATLSKTSFDCTDIGSHLVTVTVIDPSGNQTTCIVQVHVKSNSLVSNTNDSGCGSLRSAILLATAGDTITFSPSIAGDTINLTTGQLLLDKHIVIIGDDSVKTIIDGGDIDRILEVTVGDTVSLHQLIIQHGGGVTNGGGIFNDGHLTLSDCDIIDNQAANGGGIYSNQEIKIYNSLISQNSSFSTGGGLTLQSGTAFVKNTMIAGNDISFTGGAQGGGISIGTSVTATIINSVISGNVISGTTAFGAGLNMSNNSNLTIRNSTISGNTGIGSNFSQGGGFYFQSSTLDMTNSIIAKNISDSGPDIFKPTSGIIIDGGNNHISSPDGNHGITSGNNIDPLFVMDVDTTGSIATTSGDLRLACGSPAIDVGTNDTIGLNLGLVDIAGLSRVQGGNIDIGAHERAIPCTEYNDCSQVNVDLDATLLNITDPIALFRAQLELKSDATLTRDITTKAGQAILFEENFTVSPGLQLEAIIEACPE